MTQAKVGHMVFAFSHAICHHECLQAATFGICHLPLRGLLSLSVVLIASPHNIWEVKATVPPAADR